MTASAAVEAARTINSVMLWPSYSAARSIRVFCNAEIRVSNRAERLAFFAGDRFLGLVDVVDMPVLYGKLPYMSTEAVQSLHRSHGQRGPTDDRCHSADSLPSISALLRTTQRPVSSVKNAICESSAAMAESALIVGGALFATTSQVPLAALKA